MSTYIPLRTSLKLHFKIDLLTKENRTLKDKIEELQNELDEYYNNEDITKKVSIKSVIYCDPDCNACNGTTFFREVKCCAARRVFIVDSI